MSVILWFKRDLRVTDHAALARAAEIGPILPLYVIEPEFWAEPDASGRQYGFLIESLRDLKQQLEAIGLPLTVRVGKVTEVLEALREDYRITHLISHEETGNAWTYKRDQAVADWAAAQGVVWEELPQSGVIRRLSNRDVWARGRNRFVSNDIVPIVQGATGIKAASQEVPDLLPMGDAPKRQFGGRTDALRHLDSFLSFRGESYRRDMSSPLTGETACSRLSPYLALGCVSVREVAQAASGGARSATWAKSLNSFQSRLAWRDHFIQKLEDEPELEWRCLHPAYQGLRADDRDRREAWENGETGLPFVDACMRYLNQTGWLNFRMRSMVMAVASYHLWLDWRETGLHLARQFTDYEPGIHWSQVQMQSGTTGINSIRIYNPIKQGLDQDPSGAFTRRWVPELRDVPLAFLQEPWKWEGRNKLVYPDPIVDVAQAARYARETIHAVRKEGGFRERAEVVVKKHASRKDPQGRFVNDRNPRSRKKRNDPRQSSFDF